MGGTAPRASAGGCDQRACLREHGHRGDHIIRRCERRGCVNPTRNAEEHYCVLHESRSTYELYENQREEI